MKNYYVDWSKTALNLKLLRNDNLHLRRYVCRELKYNDANCTGECENCKFDMDKSISQSELAQVFGVSSFIIANWETGRTFPSLEDLLFYCEISCTPLSEVVVFKKQFTL